MHFTTQIDEQTVASTLRGMCCKTVMSMSKCFSSAFRLRRLAQNEAREFGREHFAWYLPLNRDVV